METSEIDLNVARDLNNKGYRPFRLPSSIWNVKAIKEQGIYFFHEVTEELHGSRVMVHGHDEMLMLTSYSYLGLLQHPEIENAAKAAIDRFGTGIVGSRLLAGTNSLHIELERAIADFTQTEDAIVFVSGYLANVATISSLVGLGDYVLSDRLNHASIIDGCTLSGAEFIRFKHNDMDDLARKLAGLPADTNKLVVADAVFSMDGDIFNLPEAHLICRQYGAYLMLDEAHSVGVLGATGHGIEEHFGMDPSTVDVKMCPMSKTIPSVGGYVAGSAELIEMLKHNSRGFVYSAALPPAQTAAALKSFQVIQREPWRVRKLKELSTFFQQSLNRMGFNTLSSATPIIPIICGENETAFRMAKRCQDQGLFVQGIPSPAVPVGQARLRCIVNLSMSQDDLEQALNVLQVAGKAEGII